MATIPRPRVDAIDVAHYQIVTDEAAIPALPLMTCKGSEGSTYKDPTRHMWLRIFGERNAIRGMYHWVRSDSSLFAQVENIYDCYKTAGALLPDGTLAPGWIVQLDWERTYKKVNGVNVLVRDLTVAEVDLWLMYADMKFGPGRVITYGADWVPNFVTWRKLHPERPVWYANYSLSDLPSGGQQESAKFRACVWQWGSQIIVPGLDTASRPGIDVSVILDFAELYATAHVTPPSPTPTPQPGPSPPATSEDNMIRLLILSDSPARFLAECTPQGAALRCEWTGPGDAAGSNPRIEWFRGAHPADGVPFEMTGVTIGHLKNIALNGELPPGLNASQFANEAEIKKRDKPPVTFVEDTEARQRIGVVEQDLDGAVDRMNRHLLA